jgi:hypothetical protein
MECFGSENSSCIAKWKMEAKGLKIHLVGKDARKVSTCLLNKMRQVSLHKNGTFVEARETARSKYLDDKGIIDHDSTHTFVLYEFPELA